MQFVNDKIYYLFYLLISIIFFFHLSRLFICSMNTKIKILSPKKRGELEVGYFLTEYQLLYDFYRFYRFSNDKIDFLIGIEQGLLYFYESISYRGK